MRLGDHVIALTGDSTPDRALIGNKAASLAMMAGHGLPVPPAFVVTTDACRAFLATGELPETLGTELARGVAWLEAATGCCFGRGPRPLLVSVRSGAVVSMPGMMDTVLNLGINDATEALLGDATFAADTRRRFDELFGSIVGGSPPGEPAAQLTAAVAAVFASWNGRRARRWREHQGISHDLGTAVAVQAMVFGNRCDRSGTGVVFSRNPLTGAAEPYGEWLPCGQGEDVVSGRVTPLPLDALSEAQPEVARELLAAAILLERAATDMQDIEFTVEAGRLWLLQTRTAKRSPAAAARAAVEMAAAGIIERRTAVARVSAEQLAQLDAPSLIEPVLMPAMLRAEPASPGIGQGVVVLDSDTAERRAAAGEAVVLARPTTSPDDIHGMIAARAIITELGGATSHAAVVGRSLGKPVVVGCGEGTLGALAGWNVTVDGGRGLVFEGLLPVQRPVDAPLVATLRAWTAELRTAS